MQNWRPSSEPLLYSRDWVAPLPTLREQMHLLEGAIALFWRSLYRLLGVPGEGG